MSLVLIDSLFFYSMYTIDFTLFLYFVAFYCFLYFHIPRYYVFELGQGLLEFIWTEGYTGQSSNDKHTWTITGEICYYILRFEKKLEFFAFKPKFTKKYFMQISSKFSRKPVLIRNIGLFYSFKKSP